MLRKTTRGLLRRMPFKQGIYSVVKRILTLSENTYRHLHFKGEIEIPVDSSHAFKIYHHGYQVENDLYWAGFGNAWEGTSLKLWTKLSKTSDTIIDIGANTGVYSMSALAMNPNADIIAFEPVARIYDRLKRNNDLNGGSVELVNAGASDSSGEAVIYDTDSDHAYSASLSKEMLRGHSGIIESRVPVVRVDEFLSDRPSLGTMLVKIDTEKHEHEVLQGFGNLLESNKPIFLIEILGRELGLLIEKAFAGLDYVFYEIQEGSAIIRVVDLGNAQRNYLICTNTHAKSFDFGERMNHSDL